MGKARFKSILNASGNYKMVINTAVLLGLDVSTALTYSRLVELEASEKILKDEKGYFKVSRSFITKFLPISNKTLDRSIEKLKELKLIYVKKSENANLYRINYEQGKLFFVLNSGTIIKDKKLPDYLLNNKEKNTKQVFEEIDEQLKDNHIIEYDYVDSFNDIDSW